MSTWEGNKTNDKWVINLKHDFPFNRPFNMKNKRAPFGYK